MTAQELLDIGQERAAAVDAAYRDCTVDELLELLARQAEMATIAAIDDARDAYMRARREEPDYVAPELKQPNSPSSYGGYDDSVASYYGTPNTLVWTDGYTTADGRTAHEAWADNVIEIVWEGVPSKRRAGVSSICK